MRMWTFGGLTTLSLKTFELWLSGHSHGHSHGHWVRSSWWLEQLRTALLCPHVAASGAGQAGSAKDPGKGPHRP